MSKKNKVTKILQTIICKHGTAIAALAFMVTTITANTQCTIRMGWQNLKRFNN